MRKLPNKSLERTVNRGGSTAFPELLAWAWSETPPVHKRTANLLIHIFAVPLFVVGHVLFVVGIFSSSWLLHLVASWYLSPSNHSATPSRRSSHHPSRERAISCGDSTLSSSAISGDSFSPASGMRA